MTIDPQVLEKIYRAKEQRRKDLARLPFHEKIEIRITLDLVMAATLLTSMENAR